MRLTMPMVSLLFAFASAPAQDTGRQSGQPAVPLTLKQLWTLDGSYSDAQQGVSFQYPSTWSPSLSFGYWVPAMTTANNPEPIAGFGYETGCCARSDRSGPFAHSTLEGFGIVYTALTMTSANACEARAADIAQTTAVNHARFGGRRFSIRETGTGGMSQSSSGLLYATFANGTCYLFETNTAVAAGETWDDTNAEAAAGDNAAEIYLQSVTAAQGRTIDNGLRRIMQSVRIHTR